MTAKPQLRHGRTVDLAVDHDHDAVDLDDDPYLPDSMLRRSTAATALLTTLPTRTILQVQVPHVEPAPDRLSFEK